MSMMLLISAVCITVWTVVTGWGFICSGNETFQKHLSRALSGAESSRIALTFSRSVLTPVLWIRWPRNWSWFCLSRHFSQFSFNPADSVLSKTLARCWSCCSGVSIHISSWYIHQALLACAPSCAGGFTECLWCRIKNFKGISTETC